MECEVTEYATAEDYFLAGADHDLLFLDIELKGSDSSMDGMEMAKRIRGMEDIKQPIIIFVTGGRRSRPGRGKRVLMVQYGNTGKTIPLSDIYYMESQNHKNSRPYEGRDFGILCKNERSGRRTAGAVLPCPQRLPGQPVLCG